MPITTRMTIATTSAQPALLNGRLVPLHAQHATELFHVIAIDPHGIQKANHIPQPWNAFAAYEYCTQAPRQWQNGTAARWVLQEPGQREITGYIALHYAADQPRVADLCYWLAPWTRGHGHAVHLINAVTHWASTHSDVDIIRARVAPGNIASEKTLTRAGFTPDLIQPPTGHTDMHFNV